MTKRPTIKIQTSPFYFCGLLSGKKTFLIVETDEIEEWDFVQIIEYDFKLKKASGKKLHALVTYVLDAGQSGHISPEACVIAIEVVKTIH